MFNVSVKFSEINSNSPSFFACFSCFIFVSSPDKASEQFESKSSQASSVSVGGNEGFSAAAAAAAAALAANWQQAIQASNSACFDFNDQALGALGPSAFAPLAQNGRRRRNSTGDDRAEEEEIDDDDEMINVDDDDSEIVTQKRKRVRTRIPSFMSKRKSNVRSSETSSGRDEDDEELGVDDDEAISESSSRSANSFWRPY